MTGREHVGGDAPGLAALAPDDPERIAAALHAKACAECARALREAERLQVLIERSEPVPLPVGALERVSRSIVAELRREARRRTIGSSAAACVAALVFVVIARSRSGAIDDWGRAGLVLALALALAAAANRRPLLVLGGSVVATILAGIAAAGTPIAGAPGADCLASELAAAALVLGAVWLALRGGSTSPARLAVAGVAAAGALAGDAALQVTCGLQSEVPHLLAFHVGGVLLAAAGASLLWRRPRLRVA
ncbi:MULTISPECIES: hypothetical protein [unclassified Anaeromyxobacter]|uniref:hypothetical protein n=1 Tax=unclassified Anaeromyxobacter TaxID=2620896 RepID=UPI001F5A3CEE|nr:MULTISPECIES: hypothetical protein [unclassified Anaeromyxobacter]